jgi:hypothetical protein
MCITQTEAEDAEAERAIFRGIDAYNDAVSGRPEPGRFFAQLLFLPERRRRCRVIWLDTFSFQARPFHERLGFSRFGALAGYPPGSARHFLVKRLE